MWRFKQQTNEDGQKLNIFHVDEVMPGKKPETIGVFVFMFESHATATELEEIYEFYSDDEMDSEWAEGHREGVREAGEPPPPPSPQEASSGPIGESPA